MKIAMRVFVVISMLVAGTCANAAQAKFSGPAPGPLPIPPSVVSVN
jgi:hypothetical protein